MTDEYDCGHACCGVRDNGWVFHGHLFEPAGCKACAKVDEPVDNLEAVRHARRCLEESRKTQ